MGWDGMGWDGIYCGYGVATALKIVHWSIPFLTGPYASLSFKFFTEIIFLTLWLHWGSIQHCWGSKSVKGCLKKIETHKIICLSQNYGIGIKNPFSVLQMKRNDDYLVDWPSRYWMQVPKLCCWRFGFPLRLLVKSRSFVHFSRLTKPFWIFFGFFGGKDTCCFSGTAWWRSKKGTQSFQISFKYCYLCFRIVDVHWSLWNAIHMQQPIKAFVLHFTARADRCLCLAALYTGMAEVWVGRRLCRYLV